MVQFVPSKTTIPQLYKNVTLQKMDPSEVRSVALQKHKPKNGQSWLRPNFFYHELFFIFRQFGSYGTIRIIKTVNFTNCAKNVSSVIFGRKVTTIFGI